MLKNSLTTAVIAGVAALCGVCNLANAGGFSPFTPTYTIAPCMTGAWFDPAFSGNGIDLQVVDEATSVVTVFTFFDGQRTWFTTNPNPTVVLNDNINTYTYDLYEASGDYNLPTLNSIRVVGSLSLTVFNGSAMEMSVNFDVQPYTTGFSPQSPYASQMRELVKIAGPTSCPEYQ